VTKYIIASNGTFGDIQPFRQIALCLKNLGKSVTFMTNPYWESKIREVGIDFHPIGTKEQYISVINDPSLWSDRNQFELLTKKLFIPNIYAMNEFIKKISPSQKVVIIANLHFMIDSGIAKLNNKNVVVVSGALYPSLFRTTHKFSHTSTQFLSFLQSSFIQYFEKKWDKKLMLSDYYTPLNHALEEKGLLPLKKYNDLYSHIAEKNLLLFPQWYGPIHQEWPHNLIQGDFILNQVGDIPPQPFEKELDIFLKKNPNPIMFTFGTGNIHSEELFQLSIEVISKLQLTAIFISRDRHLLPKNLPPSSIWVSTLEPFSQLLSKCALIVYHGGIGTLAEAIQSKVPHLVIPFQGDQWDNAERIQNLNLGLTISSAKLTVSNFSKAIQFILDSDEIKRNCNIYGPKVQKRLSVMQITKKMLIDIFDDE
jgi:rhamnosyltransferase subunit B